MFCKNCGKELPDNSKFCSSCGTPVTAPALPQDPPVDQTVFMRPADEAVISNPDPAAQEPDTSEPSPASEDAAAQEPDASEAPPVSDDAAAPQEPDASAVPPVIEDVPAEQESGASAPPVPFARPSVAVIAPAADAPQDSGALGSSPAKRRGTSFLVVAGVAVVAIIALIVLAVKLIPSLFSGGGSSAIVYLNDDGELMYLADLKEKTEALELTDEADANSSVQFSPDGKTVYFTDIDSTLYCAAVAELKKGGKPERISREVSSFSVLKDGRVLYRQFDSTDGSKLYLYDGTESFRLIRDYYLYALSADQKTLYYTEKDESDGTLTLYKMAMEKDAKGERLLKGADHIYTRYDADILIYGVEDSSYSSSNNITVYTCTPGGDKTKIADGVYSVTDTGVNGGKADFYYYIQDVEERALYDFVTDSKASEDAATLSAEEPEYPDWNDYEVYDIWIDEDAETYSLGVVYYTSWSGKEYPIDVSELLTMGFTLDDLYGMYWELYDIAWEDAMERYDAAAEDYYARYDIWWEAQSREYMREDLKDTQYSQTSYSLYHYTGSGKGDAIATGLQSIASGSPAGGIFLYQKADQADGTVADVADLEYYDQVYDMLHSGSGDDENVWYQNVGGKESEIDLEDVTRILNIFVLNGAEAVLFVYDGYESSLRSYAIGKDALTFNSTIIEGQSTNMMYGYSQADDFSYPQLGTISGSDVFYLFTDLEGDYSNLMGDLSIYSDGRLETLAKEVYGAYFFQDSGTIYVISDIDSRGNRELSLLKDGKTTVITDELGSQLMCLDGAQLLYTDDGDLMLWDGKESRRIARDVEHIWTSTKEDYFLYTPNSTAQYYWS